MKEAPILIGDIGGTKARFALAEPGPGRPLIRDIVRLPTADFDSLQEAAGHYLAGLDTRPRKAAIAVASPVRGDDIRLTNLPWSFKRGELAEALGLEQVHLLNDFGATARAVAVLEKSEYESLSGPVRTPLAAPISVIGAGTGFGMALLLDCPAHRWRVVETEGGHISYAPLGGEEQHIHQWLSARHGRVSVERVLSGSGLAKLHAALTGDSPGMRDLPDDKLRDPADIVAAAMADQDRLARQALDRFCAILGSVAGDAALIHGASTLAIAGGIVPRFIPFLKSSAFRERFLDKGRYAAYLDQVQVVVVTYPEPGLLGAALSLVGPELL
ncbi:MAG: glucokinase [Wenzhouxiangella sp.]|nr:glucokinase [Wenzhouxiangella sp.]MCH8477747.1 glucokinase [Wenzhouxiangella sp.]